MANFKRRMFFAFVIIVLLLAIGTVYYSYAEGWTYVDSFYFSTMTLTTIGYGDLAPTTEHAKIFTSLYAIFGIGVMLYILSSVIGVFVFRQEKYMSRALSFLGRVRGSSRERKEEMKMIKEEMEKPFIREIRKHEREIKEQEREMERLEKKIKEPFIREMEKHEEEIKKLRKKVKPSIKRVKEQEKEIKALERKIKKRK